MKQFLSVFLFCFLFLHNNAQTFNKNETLLPEALFSNDGKYALIQNYDTLNECKVAAWSLYLNETGEELSIIIPKNDTAFFVSYFIERNYYPYFQTSEGCILNCRIVNLIPIASFLAQYDLTVKPLELAYKINVDIDTFKVKNVSPPFTDTLIETKFCFSYFLDTHLLMLDTIQTNLDSTMQIVKEGADRMERLRLYYSPKTNNYWFQSAVYNENFSFKQVNMYQDTIILTNLTKEVSNDKKFGKLIFSPLY